MKQFQNKKTTITVEQITNDKKEVVIATYAYLGRMVMNQVNPQQGINTVAMKKNFRVLDVLEKAIEENPETFELEDADAVHFAEKVKGFNWNFQHRDLPVFEEEIEQFSKQ